jgi:dUTP pyrophosphatase
MFLRHRRPPSLFFLLRSHRPTTKMTLSTVTPAPASAAAAVPAKRTSDESDASIATKKVASQDNVPTAQTLKVKKLSDKAKLPLRGSPLAAGYDLFR